MPVEVKPMGGMLDVIENEVREHWDCSNLVERIGMLDPEHNDEMLVDFLAHCAALIDSGEREDAARISMETVRRWIDSKRDDWVEVEVEDRVRDWNEGRSPEPE
jgi:hypothetical protein